ncbi:MAG TPA: SLBB domain-containing protein [Candidatus Dojkabacteria bacterium]|nr:SLBB domain-containing protein [Candidatus Dojkabacteria bacterium]
MASFIEQHKSIIITVVLLIALISIRVYYSVAQKEEHTETIIAPLVKDLNSITPIIFVEIWGGVKYPGVYEVTDNILVIDLVNLAGGFTDNADHVFAEKNITLSKKVSSEMKVYIPFMDSNNENAKLGLINLNYATRDALISIKGIGEATADKIIAHRPFLDWEDLKQRTEIRSDIIQILKDSSTI